jgi:hypothetical protein
MLRVCGGGTGPVSGTGTVQQTASKNGPGLNGKLQLTERHARVAGIRV